MPRPSSRAFYTSTLRDMRRTYQRAFKAVLLVAKLHLSVALRSRRPPIRTRLSPREPFLLRRICLLSPHQQQHHLRSTPRKLRPEFPSPDRISTTPPRPDSAGDCSNPSTPCNERRPCSTGGRDSSITTCMRNEVLARRQGTNLAASSDDALVKNPSNPPASSATSAPIPARERHRPPLLPGSKQPHLQRSPAPTSKMNAGSSASGRPNAGSAHSADHFHYKNLSKARPDPWASTDPSASLPAAGVSETGNANLCRSSSPTAASTTVDPRRYLRPPSV